MKSINRVEKEIGAIFLYDFILIELDRYQAQFDQEMTSLEMESANYALNQILLPNIKALAAFCQRGLIHLNHPPTEDYCDQLWIDYKEDLSKEASDQLAIIRRSMKQYFRQKNRKEDSLFSELFDVSTKFSYHSLKLLEPLLPYFDLELDTEMKLLETFVAKQRIEPACYFFKEVLKKYGKQHVTKTKKELKQAFSKLSAEDKKQYQFLVDNVLFQGQQYDQETFYKNKREQDQIGRILMEQYPNEAFNKQLRQTIDVKEEFKHFLFQLLSKENIKTTNWNQFIKSLFEHREIDYDILDLYYFKTITQNDNPSIYDYDTISQNGFIDFSKLYWYDQENDCCWDLLETAINKNQLQAPFLLYRYVPKFQEKHQKNILNYFLRLGHYNELMALKNHQELSFDLSVLETIKGHFLPLLSSEKEEDHNKIKDTYLTFLNYVDQSLPSNQGKELKRMQVMNIVDVVKDNERDLTLEETMIFDAYYKANENQFWSLSDQDLASEVKQKLKQKK